VIVKVRFKVNVKLSKNEEMLTANGNLILERKLGSFALSYCANAKK
jgi:hypothetical protein